MRPQRWWNTEGDKGLTQNLREAIAVFGERAAGGQVPADFIARYLATQERAVATVPEPGVRSQLQTIIDGVAQEYAAGR